MNRRRNHKSNRDRSNRYHASDVVRRKKCVLLIDGYNLMHVTQFKPTGTDEGELRRCREGLLSLLAGKLSAAQYRRIVVVFDSEDAPKHLPDEILWQHLEVVFARNENSADDHIVQMVGQHANPQQVIVVSSDHRVQIAAQRRRAIWIDSDPWIEAALEYADSNEVENAEQAENVEPTMSPEELDEFRQAMKGPISADPERSSQTVDDPDGDNPDMGEAEDEFENPFPKGYFDGLEDET